MLNRCLECDAPSVTSRCYECTTITDEDTFSANRQEAEEINREQLEIIISACLAGSYGIHRAAKRIANRNLRRAA